MRIAEPTPDYLGPTYRSRVVYLDASDGATPEGQSDIAVLVYEEDAAGLVAESGVATLYLPGFSDTFYQTDLSDAWRRLSIPLVALEMRRDGRAVRSETTRGDLRDLRVRNEEIGAAIDFLRNELGAQKVVLVAHSLGALNAQLWVSEHPETVDALVYVSPWLEHRVTPIERSALSHTNNVIGRVAPRSILGLFPPYYPRSLHVEYGGEFYFSPRHKPLKTIPIHAGFYRAVHIAQRQVQAGELKVDIPAFVAFSDRSGNSLIPSADDLATRDCVLNVEENRRWASEVSTRTVVREIPGARHDIAVSRKPVREAYMRQVADWVVETLGLTPVTEDSDS